jgi:hypothetical protein
LADVTNHDSGPWTDGELLRIEGEVIYAALRIWTAW